MSGQKEQQKGFTIIEVVLVLAIAGLIFLMVFIALPSLQRSQRDTQRRNDLSRFTSQLQSYSTNNKGQIPSSSAKLDVFKDGYLKTNNGEFNDPKSGDPYRISYGIKQPGVGEIQYSARATCDGETMTSASSTRQAAVITQLEGSGYFCQTNQ